MTDIVKRHKIDMLEEAMRELPNQIVIEDMLVNHYFTDAGLYAREMLIPAGTLITGKIKKHEHISVISSGFVSEVTEAGVQHLRAPHTMVSKPGTKRVVLAHEDTVWTTIHHSFETDLAKLEAELIASTHVEYNALSGSLAKSLEDST